MTTHLTVTSTETLTPSLRRVWFSSGDLSAFTGSHATDRYVKLVFPRPGTELAPDFDMREARSTMAPEDLPVVRTYTAMFPDVAAGTLAIDFVVHGDEGVAGPWAMAAVPGDTLLANGPGGGFAPNHTADWHLFVGDESAVPAITAGLAALMAHDEELRARVVVLVDSADHEPSFPMIGAESVRFLHRSAGETLEQGVRELTWLRGEVEAFVHGEAESVMKGIRPYLLHERGVDRQRLSISGYWREGRSEEGFREWKAEQRAD